MEEGRRQSRKQRAEQESLEEPRLRVAARFAKEGDLAAKEFGVHALGHQLGALAVEMGDHGAGHPVAAPSGLAQAIWE